jgi:hypothetical protein
MTTDIRLEKDGRKIRFTDFIDAESLAFEAEAGALLADAPIEQRLVYYQDYSHKYFVLQIRGRDGKPASQLCVHIGRPKLMPWFAMATVRNLHPAINAEEEEFGLKMLQELAPEMPGVMTLRLQPKIYDSSELLSFQARAIRAQFLAADEPLGVTRTLLLDLGPDSDELLARLPSRTRQKIRHHSRAKVTICALEDPKYIKSCREAADVARIRTGAGPSSDDFETSFALAKSHPDRCKVIGLFFNHRPTELLAYAIGFNNGKRVEFYSAGAVHDPELRSIPFNSFLVWELINWARHQGCTEMDMGGITDGGPNDPLQGVSKFKRGMTENEVETGREMIHTVRPLRHKVYKWLKQLREPKRDGGLAPIYD